VGGDDDLLRREALQAVGPHGDPRASAALEQGAVTSEVVWAWEETRGRMSGREVTLLLPVQALAPIALNPSAHDALERAFAIAVATLDPGESLVGLRLRWAPVTIHEGGYRDAPQPRVGERTVSALRSALGDYLRAVGSVHADAATRAHVEVAGERFTVVLHPSDRAAREDVERALSTLLGEAAAK
jgi:hypothetical protein